MKKQNNISSILLALLLLFVSIVQAEGQKLSIHKQTINLGNTLWKRPVTARIAITNKDSRTPLIITNVDPGCGCMKVEWSKGPIYKGNEAEVNVTYDAKQLGTYDRYIYIYTNASQSPAKVRIKGRITNGQKKAVEDVFPYRIDDILLSTNNLEFPDVYRNDSSQATIELYNDGKDVYTPQLMHLPSYITATFSPSMIARGRHGKATLTLHGDQMPDFGLNQTSIYLARYLGDKVATNNDIELSAILLPDPTVTVNSSRQPIFSISTNELNMGKIGKKKKLNSYVQITNNGSGVMSLKKIQAFNRAISVNLPKTDIQPHESIKMKISLNTEIFATSKAQPRILLITNDPNHPKVIINMVFDK